MWSFRDKKIADWEPGYYPNINEATPDQQRSYVNIKKRIEKNEYVDIGTNNAYLYAYRYDLNSRILNARNVDEWLPLYELYSNFINLYCESKPKVTSYFYPWMIIASVLLKNDVRNDIEQFIDFMIQNNISGYNDFIASIFATSHNLSSQDSVNVKFFRAFVGTDLRQYLTETGKKNYQKVMNEVFDLLRADYTHSGINFVYRLFDFTNGILAVDNVDYLQVLSKKEFRTIHYSDPSIKLYVRKPLFNEKSRLTYVKYILTEAENIYRQKSGLQKIGEGWVSETLLYKQIEAAFNESSVEQHSSPGFLGRQHYDVYLPEHKIALEYQGAQHHRPIEFFGGEEAYKKNVERDKKKKRLSIKNGVTQIDVLPDYTLAEIVKEVATLIYEKDESELRALVSKAIDRVENISEKEVTAGLGPAMHSKIVSKISDTQDTEEIEDYKLSLRIKKLVAARKPSSYAHQDHLDIPDNIFNEMLEKLREVKELSKVNPEESNKLAIKLFDSGYRAPAIYGRMAINYRKMGDLKSEADLLIQMKRDFDYNNFDERIKKVLKMLGTDYR